jgi:hypothetical protein
VLRPFGVRLVWGAYDGEGALLKTFRPLEDGSLTDEEDEAVALEAGGAARTIGILHPLELEDAARRRWLTHLGDYEIKPPFAQLERPVRLITTEEAGVRTFKIGKAGEEKSVSGGTFSGRAGRLGWGRGPDEERSIPFFYKSFPLAGIDFMLFVDGYYLGMDPSENVTLSQGLFVRAGSIDFKFFEFPEDEKDERVIAIGKVPPIVFSEVAGDLEKIGAGKKETD